MIHLTKNIASENIILTLNELKTLSSPYYLMVFTHIETKEVVNKIFAPGDELSTYPERYNRFAIATSTLFLNKPLGVWNYIVYEQASSTNADTSLTTGVVEYGKMKLQPATDFTYDQYNESTTYKAYQS